MPFSVVFLGTSAFAVPSLRALAKDSRFEIRLVITQPDRPVGRKQVLTPPPVKVVAEELNLPILQPEKINQEFLIATRYPLTADFFVVVSYGQILSQDILDLPGIAPVNVHASLLPLLRGASPLQHAILQGMKESGVTVQRMVKKLDAGPILAQTTVEILPQETYRSLHDKLAEEGAKLLIETLVRPLAEREQDENGATFCGKLTKEDGRADPATMTAETIDRMVRGLSPWPSVTINGHKILETSLQQSEEGLALACANGTTLSITRLQPPSGKPMSGSAFSRGHSLSPSS